MIKVYIFNNITFRKVQIKITKHSGLYVLVDKSSIFIIICINVKLEHNEK